MDWICGLSVVDVGDEVVGFRPGLPPARKRDRCGPRRGLEVPTTGSVLGIHGDREGLAGAVLNTSATPGVNACVTENVGLGAAVSKRRQVGRVAAVPTVVVKLLIGARSSGPDVPAVVVGGATERR